MLWGRAMLFQAKLSRLADRIVGMAVDKRIASSRLALFGLPRLTVGADPDLSRCGCEFKDRARRRLGAL
jgi:hypothetical protein